MIDLLFNLPAKSGARPPSTQPRLPMNARCNQNALLIWLNAIKFSLWIDFQKPSGGNAETAADGRLIRRGFFIYLSNSFKHWIKQYLHAGKNTRVSR